MGYSALPRWRNKEPFTNEKAPKVSYIFGAFLYSFARIFRIFKIWKIFSP